jgi:hypothetical protein
MRRTRETHVPRLAVVALAWTLGLAGAHASVPKANRLGFVARVDPKKPGVVLLEFTPKVAMARVAVEAGSGVSKIAGTCALSLLEAGRRYGCRLALQGPVQEPGMTLNIVAFASGPVGSPPAPEVHHVTVPNPKFVRSKFVPGPTHHVLESYGEVK